MQASDRNSSPSTLATFIADVEVNGFALPEPASIIVSSLILFGARHGLAPPPDQPSGVISATAFPLARTLECRLMIGGV